MDTIKTINFGVENESLSPGVQNICYTAAAFAGFLYFFGCLLALHFGFVIVYQITIALMFNVLMARHYYLANKGKRPFIDNPFNDYATLAFLVLFLPNFVVYLAFIKSSSDAFALGLIVENKEMLGQLIKWGVFKVPGFSWDWPLHALRLLCARAFLVSFSIVFFLSSAVNILQLSKHICRAFEKDKSPLTSVLIVFGFTLLAIPAVLQSCIFKLGPSPRAFAMVEGFLMACAVPLAASTISVVVLGYLKHLKNRSKGLE